MDDHDLAGKALGHLVIAANALLADPRGRHDSLIAAIECLELQEDLAALGAIDMPAPQQNAAAALTSAVVLLRAGTHAGLREIAERLTVIAARVRR